MRRMSAKSVPELSITLVVWNALPRLRDCLDSIAPDVAAGFAEVIAADNASPDESANTVEKVIPGANVISMDENCGFAGGVNRTWPHVQGRYWLLLNPDTIVPPGGLRAFVAWMDNHPEIGIASPALADADGEHVRPTGHPVPSAALVLAEALRIHKLFPRDLRARVFQGPYWTGGDNLNAGWVPGTAMIVRREAAERVGLPDEHFFLYGEDIDWCWRMRRAGWRVGYCSSVVVRHAESDTNLREYGQRDTLLRIARTELDAVRRARGSLRASLYGAALVFALGLESIHPGRSRAGREHTRMLLKAWAAALTRHR
jgi:GT2 family glycosyltransferase